MPRFTNKTTGVTVDLADGAPLPAPEGEWEPGNGSPKRKRRADTGSVPVQNDGR